MFVLIIQSEGITTRIPLELGGSRTMTGVLEGAGVAVTGPPAFVLEALARGIRELERTGGRIV